MPRTASPAPRPRVSVIVPVLNEEAGIEAFLDGLADWRRVGHEVIVIDGGSRDATPRLAAAGADRVLSSAPGRAGQMQAGLAAAQGEVLLFLHADTQLPAGAAGAILEGLEASGRTWGRFDVRLSGRHPLLRVVERAMNLRSRLTGIATGDQAIFVRREALERAGGLPAVALMEDILLSRRLRRLGPPLCLSGPALTSSRRWETHGVLRTIGLMWALRLAFFFGVSPDRLAHLYYGRGARIPGQAAQGRERRA